MKHYSIDCSLISLKSLFPGHEIDYNIEDCWPMINREIIFNLALFNASEEDQEAKTTS